MTVAKKLYVGNLTYDTTEDNLVELFSEYGEVLSAQIIIDRETNLRKFKEQLRNNEIYYHLAPGLTRL